MSRSPAVNILALVISGGLFSLIAGFVGEAAGMDLPTVLLRAAAVATGTYIIVATFAVSVAATFLAPFAKPVRLPLALVIAAPVFWTLYVTPWFALAT